MKKLQSFFLATCIIINSIISSTSSDKNEKSSSFSSVMKELKEKSKKTSQETLETLTKERANKKHQLTITIVSTNIESTPDNPNNNTSSDNPDNHSDIEKSNESDESKPIERTELSPSCPPSFNQGSYIPRSRHEIRIEHKKQLKLKIEHKKQLKLQLNNTENQFSLKKIKMSEEHDQELIVPEEKHPKLVPTFKLTTQKSDLNEADYSHNSNDNEENDLLSRSLLSDQNSFSEDISGLYNNLENLTLWLLTKIGYENLETYKHACKEKYTNYPCLLTKIEQAHSKTEIDQIITDFFKAE